MVNCENLLDTPMVNRETTFGMYIIIIQSKTSEVPNMKMLHKTHEYAPILKEAL